MKALRVTCLALGIAAALAAMSGCGASNGSVTVAPPPVDELAGLDAVLQLWNADVGEEGMPVAREAVEPTFREDAELRTAILMPQESAFTTGTGE